jgi:hypothetical protein
MRLEERSRQVRLGNAALHCPRATSKSLTHRVSCLLNIAKQWRTPDPLLISDSTYATSSTPRWSTFPGAWQGRQAALCIRNRREARPSIACDQSLATLLSYELQQPDRNLHRGPPPGGRRQHCRCKSLGFSPWNAGYEQKIGFLEVSLVPRAKPAPSEGGH